MSQVQRTAEEAEGEAFDCCHCVVCPPEGTLLHACLKHHKSQQSADPSKAEQPSPVYQLNYYLLILSFNVRR